MKILTLFFITSVMTVLSSSSYADDIVITDAYARASGKKAKAGAAFLVIENNSDEEDRLLSADSTASKMVQLHTHEKGDNGIVKMLHVQDGFVIPAGGMHRLKRGADHIMFIGLIEPWEHGDRLEVILTFEKAGDIRLSVPVDMEREHSSHDH